MWIWQSTIHHQKTFSDSQLPSTLPSQQRKDSKWEILTSLEQGATYNLKPEAYEDFLTKRRKWPLKGNINLTDLQSVCNPKISFLQSPTFFTYHFRLVQALLPAWEGCVDVRQISWRVEARPNPWQDQLGRGCHLIQNRGTPHWHQRRGRHPSPKSPRRHTILLVERKVKAAHILQTRSGKKDAL